MTYIQPGPVVPHKHEWVIVGMDFDRNTAKVTKLRHACYCGEKSEWAVQGDMNVRLMDAQ